MSSMAQPGQVVGIAFENAPCAIVVTKKRYVIECNKGFRKLFGYSRDELIGQLMLKMYPSYEDFIMIGELRYKEMLQEKICADERFMKNKDGEVFWCKTEGNTLTPGSPFDLAIWTFAKINIKQESSTNLSLREREVSSYIANGYTCKEVARHLGISHRTVEAHRAKIMKKLGCRNTAELVSKIIQLDA